MKHCRSCEYKPLLSSSSLTLIRITYARTHFSPAPSPSQFIARITTTNIASIKLFEKLGFETVKIVEVFNEAEMRLADSKWASARLEGRIAHYDV